jgi:signal transduction histidine kinase
VHNLVGVNALEPLAGLVGTGANLALGVVMAAALGLEVRGVAGATGRWPFELVVGLVICAVALLRGRNRAWAAAIGLAIFGLAALAAALWNLPTQPLTSGALVGLLVLGAAAIRALPLRSAAVIAVVGTIVVAVGEAGHAADTFDAQALFGLTGAVLWAAALGVGLWLRHLDRQHRSAVEAIRRDERLELARELHDVVAHHVTGIVVQAQAATFVGAEHPQALVSALASIESAGTDAMSSMRRLVDLLRDSDDTDGFASSPEPLDELVERFAKHGPSVDLRVPADLRVPPWPREVSTTIYRIVQESLTNIARHAPDARSVTVTVAHDTGRVTVEITDDARVVTSVRSPLGNGYGLVGMRERVEALGGKVRAGPLAQAGWSVHASLPVGVRGRS